MPDSLSVQVTSTLHEGLVSLGYNDVPELELQLRRYLQLLLRWNKAYNLTAVRDPLEMVTRHLLDSLSIARYIPATAQHIVDVGTGAGLPGVPLSLLNPQQQYSLVDSNGKKTRFLFQVKTELGLANMSVHRTRAEAWVPSGTYDVVLSRAFASLIDMVQCCGHFCSETGVFLAMKGTIPEAELSDVEALCDVRNIYPLQVPGLREERHLIELAPVRER